MTERLDAGLKKEVWAINQPTGDLATTGKAHDLRVATYLIWSFYSPSQKVIAGARGLGIDLEPLGFDTEHRQDLVRSPDILIARVAYSQEQARRHQSFALAVATFPVTRWEAQLSGYRQQWIRQSAAYSHSRKVRR
jgi:hypothetical protein